jgi:hypothetical protein
MPAVRYLVHDVDAVLPFYAALGFREVDRWGPPFAIVERDGPRAVAGRAGDLGAAPDARRREARARAAGTGW